MRRAIGIAVLAALAFGACGGRGPGAGGPRGGGIWRAEQAALDEAARAGAVTETIHGRQVDDPFRSLEEDSPGTRAWIDGQNAITERYLDQHSDAAAAARLETLMSIGTLGSPKQAGGRTFYEKREGEQDQPALWVVEEGSAGPRILVDPDALGSRVALDWYFPSPSGRYVAYGLSHEGDERSTLRVLDVDSGEALPEAIEHTKWTSVSWLGDESGLYYTRYPRPGEPDWDAEEQDVYFQHMFFHALGVGADGAEDPLVLRMAAKTDFASPEVSPDDRFVVLNVFHGWSQSDVFLLDRTAPGGVPEPVDAGGDHLVSGEVHGGRLYMMTNEDHPRYRIVAAPLGTAGDRSTWVEVLSEGDTALDVFGFAADRLVVKDVKDMASRIRLFGPDGAPEGEIETPVAGSISGPAVQRSRDEVVFALESFFQPPTLYAYEPGTGTLREADRVAGDVDPSRYELEQEWVASEDGTPINVFLAHERGIARDGERPVLVYGYGGFNVSLLPYFRSHALYWLERGGVLATANLRGGAELGEEWHRAGMLGNKHHVFEDFEAVIRWLPGTGLTRPGRIAVYGASNGGLLVGAMIVRCPDAFRAAAAYVGLYDMVRFDRFPPAEIWMSEYGDPSAPGDFEYLLAYSPYHRVVEGTAYPSVLVETAERDTRVSWKHSVKFAARLQGASGSDAPILFYMDRSVGHGAGTGLSDAVRERARMYAFLETELGMR